MSFFETSVKTNKNVNEVFIFLTQEILKSNERQCQAGSGLDKLKADKGKDGKNECYK